MCYGFHFRILLFLVKDGRVSQRRLRRAAKAPERGRKDGHDE
jgi:hypothetical protein